jgi:hypothetical protein
MSRAGVKVELTLALTLLLMNFLSSTNSEQFRQPDT